MTNGESAKDMTSKFAKLDKFEGQDFRRWQKKMHFFVDHAKGCVCSKYSHARRD